MRSASTALPSSRMTRVGSMRVRAAGQQAHVARTNAARVLAPRCRGKVLASEIKVNSVFDARNRDSSAWANSMPAAPAPQNTMRVVRPALALSKIRRSIPSDGTDERFDGPHCECTLGARNRAVLHRAGVDGQHVEADTSPLASCTRFAFKSSPVACRLQEARLCALGQRGQKNDALLQLVAARDPPGQHARIHLAFKKGRPR